MKKTAALLDESFDNGNIKKTCPPCKIIKGTKFAVDGFCYGDLPGVDVYFLTHFHQDHYRGLTEHFSHPIYCTKITGDLCQQILHVNPEYINILKENQTVSILGVNVTAINAFHCPGSVMLIFNLPNGQNILHTGDFRAYWLMKCRHMLKNININTLYLDTTFCDPIYKFPSQAACIEMAISILIQKEESMYRKKIDFSKLLIVCGTYTIGKEKFFLELAKILDLKIWAAPEKCLILKTAIGKEFGKIPPQLCRLHLLPMQQLNYDDLENYLRKYDYKFTEILAFKPSGWEYCEETHIKRGNITIHGIPYSDHSSFTELQNFVRFCKPVCVISTIPDHANGSKIQRYFSCPVGTESYVSQKKISDYFVAKDANN